MTNKKINGLCQIVSEVISKSEVSFAQTWLMFVKMNRYQVKNIETVSKAFRKRV